jgi:hypothetical protein
MVAGNASDELRFRSRRPAFNGISLFGVRPLTQKLAPRIPSIAHLACVRTAKYFNRGRSRIQYQVPPLRMTASRLKKPLNHVVSFLEAQLRLSPIIIEQHGITFN